MNTAPTVALPQSALTLYDFLVKSGGAVTLSKSQIQAATGLGALDLMIAEAYLSDGRLINIDLVRKGGSGRRGRVLRVIA